MNTTIIWRLEDEGGRGIYAYDYFDEATNYEKTGADGCAGSPHPTPSNDPALGWYDIPDCDRDHYHFGFATLSQMRQWVYKAVWRRKLSDMDILLNKYEVPAEFARRSNFQAVFWKDKATLIESRRPDYADKSRVKRHAENRASN